MSEKRPKLSLPKIETLVKYKDTPKSFELPIDYTISKFYELGYKVSYNKYGNTYNSCCPLCKEGKSWGRSKRCYFIPENDNIFCHNCGESMKPYNWIRRVSGMSDKELWDDLNNNCTSVDTKLEQEEFIPKKQQSLPDDSINLFDPNQISYYAKDHIVQTALAYIKSRKLDTAINKPDALYLSKKDFIHKNRLTIPFKNTEGKIIFYQTRRLFEWDDKPQYLSKLNSDKSVFGIERVDPSLDEVFIFEGPIDACFVKNGVAVAGINQGHHRFTQTQIDQLEELKLFKKIWVLDSQWVDETSRLKTEILLKMGECVFLWPKKWGQYKDFNEICMKHNLDKIGANFIKENAHCGNKGILKFKMMFSNIT